MIDVFFKFYERKFISCQNTMKNHQWVIAKLIHSAMIVDEGLSLKSSLNLHFFARI